ncbi:hypothetical protein [Streptomyces abikoensis]
MGETTSDYMARTLGPVRRSARPRCCWPSR